jgi:antitoxin component YwqK of YwqJK toxin-antitoxin module
MRTAVLIIIISFLTACKEGASPNSSDIEIQPESKPQAACSDCMVTEKKKDGSQIEKYYKNGNIKMTLENHTRNTKSIVREWDKKKYVPNKKAYCRTYYSNGKIKGEGWLLWSANENPDSYLSVESGTWKYYNEKGEIINVRDYKH